MTQTRNRPGVASGAASQQVGETTTSLTAGVTLRAAESLRAGQQTFTRAQVAYLMHLAYESGRTATYLDDIAQVVCCWEDRPFLRKTYEQRKAEEIAEMDAHARRRAEREGRPYRIYRGGPVDWETGRELRRPEPYSSSANGTTLTVSERQSFGELGRVA